MLVLAIFGISVDARVQRSLGRDGRRAALHRSLPSEGLQDLVLSFTEHEHARTTFIKRSKSAEQAGLVAEGKPLWRTKTPKAKER